VKDHDSCKIPTFQTRPEAFERSGHATRPRDLHRGELQQAVRGRRCIDTLLCCHFSFFRGTQVQSFFFRKSAKSFCRNFFRREKIKNKMGLQHYNNEPRARDHSGTEKRPLNSVDYQRSKRPKNNYPNCHLERNKKRNRKKNYCY